MLAMVMPAIFLEIVAAAVAIQVTKSVILSRKVQLTEFLAIFFCNFLVST